MGVVFTAKTYGANFGKSTLASDSTTTSTTFVTAVSLSVETATDWGAAGMWVPNGIFVAAEVRVIEGGTITLSQTGNVGPHTFVVGDRNTDVAAVTVLIEFKSSSSATTSIIKAGSGIVKANNGIILVGKTTPSPFVTIDGKRSLTKIKIAVAGSSGQDFFPENIIAQNVGAPISASVMGAMQASTVSTIADVDIADTLTNGLSVNVAGPWAAEFDSTNVMIRYINAAYAVAIDWEGTAITVVP